MIKVMQRETYVSDLADEYRRDENEKLTHIKRKRTEYKGGNGMQKVKLPREVAEAIEGLRKITCSDYEIICVVQSAHANPNAITVRDWFADGGGTRDLLMEALVNGYEIEKSPEEILREYYAELKRREERFFGRPMSAGCSPSSSEAVGVRRTLDILGIKIGGINGRF